VKDGVMAQPGLPLPRRTTIFNPSQIVALDNWHTGCML
jgi:hypothetical protein